MLSNYLTKANTALESKNYIVSANNFEKAYRMSTKDTLYLYNAALLATSNQSFDKAINLFKKLQEQYSDIPNYKVSSTEIKMPAGWLIEQCGWKGRRVGNTGSHAKQALVLVNYGNATGKEILRLSIKIINSVEKKFGIKLKLEVNVL